MGFFEILVIVLLVLVLIGGLVAVVFGLPGTWLILTASILYAWFTDFTVISVKLLLLLFAIAAIAELMEFGASVWGARRYGGTKRAMVGTLLGGLLGAIALSPLMFGLGSIFGAFLGAFAGAFCMTYLEERKMGEAARVGWGAFLGRVVATVFKGAAAVTMIGLDIWALIRAP
jgi:uncharacterized protein YqgC (DUF456 family)